MERLVDKKNFTGPGEARLQRLVQASAPVAVTDADKHRVLAEVLERRHAPRIAGLLLRPVMIAALLFLAAGVTAATTLGRRWLEQRAPAPAAPPSSIPAPPRVHVAHPVVAPPAPAADTAPPEPERPVTRPARGRAGRAGEYPARIVAAIKALRTDHDPKRAAVLLAVYLRTYPRGALAEEALALSIEAAVDRGSPHARVLAERYLAQYPAGRFRRMAENALASSANAPSIRERTSARK